MSTSNTNREVLVELAQPAAERLSRSLSHAQLACLKRKPEEFKEAVEVARKAIADITTALDMLKD